MKASLVGRLVLPLLALGGIGRIWLSLRGLKRDLDQLQQLHATSATRDKGGVDTRQILQRLAQSQTGVVPQAQIFEKLSILGFSDQVFDLGFQPGSPGIAIQDFEVDIPQGTTQIIPTLTRFTLSYGVPLLQSDHHLDVEVVNINIKEIRQAQSQAIVELSMNLTDRNFNNPWTGSVSSRLLFLGPS